MFNRTLLDNDDFFATSGLFGGITVKLKGRGLKVKANRLENTKFLDICDELKRKGCSVSPDSKEFKDILEMFCESLCGRGDARWQAFFVVMTCEEIVGNTVGE
jgi:hypothetical protein|tara:strand:- start:994 stop:1302 length:309 start_codon:yes stop_codon:yes gene_type:complete